jgi:hypothetical protein
MARECHRIHPECHVCVCFGLDEFRFCPQLSDNRSQDLVTWKKGFTDSSNLLYQLSLQSWEGRVVDLSDNTKFASLSLSILFSLSLSLLCDCALSRPSGSLCSHTLSFLLSLSRSLSFLVGIGSVMSAHVPSSIGVYSRK